MRILVITALSYRKPDLSSLFSILQEKFPHARLIRWKEFKAINTKSEVSTLLSYSLIDYVAQADVVVSYLNGPSSGRTLEQLYASLLGIPVIGIEKERVLSPFDCVGIGKVVRSEEELVEEIKRVESLHPITKVALFLRKKLFHLLLKLIFLTSLRAKLASF